MDDLNSKQAEMRVVAYVGVLGFAKGGLVLGLQLDDDVVH